MHFFTSPFETSFYFLVKALLVFILELYLFSRRNIDVYNIFFTSLSFMFLFSFYYRSLELITGIHFGARVPDIIFGNKKILFSKNPYLSAIIWAIVHFFANFIPNLFVWKNYL
jgi:hypothetical protein